MSSTSRLATALLLAMTGALSLAPAAAQAQFPITESFQSSTAPGWLLRGTASLTGGGVDPTGQGWLRLTSNAGGQAGSAIYNTPFPSSQGIVVTFDYADYGGSGADGFTFYLIDGSTASPTVGSAGGPLGYAAKYTSSTCPTSALTETSPGVTNGYVGIGFDEFGNFSNCESGLGAPGANPQSVVIRGSGSTTAVAYRYLTGTQVSGAPFYSQIDNVLRSFPRHVRISIINQVIKTEMDFGSGYQPVISGYDLSGATGQVALPANFKMGLSGSTGGSTNTHEIRNLNVTLPVNLTLGQTASPATVAVGGTVTYILTVSNDATNVAAGVSVSDVFPAGLAGVTWSVTGTTNGGSATTPSGSGALSDTVNLPKSSSVTFTVTGTVTASAAGTSLSNTVTVTAPSGQSNLLSSTTATAVPVTTMATATALASSLGPSIYGEGITLTATVSSPVSGTPTGTVTFYDGATSLGSAALSGGVAQRTVSTLAGGPHTLTAVYGGASNYATSTSAPVSQQVDRAPTGITLTSSLPTSTYGDGVTFTAAVGATTFGVGPPTGTISLSDFDGVTTTILGSASLNGSGVATLSTAGLGAGSHQITASYAGDGDYSESSTGTATTQVVAKASATIVLAASPAPAVTGQSVALSATVTSLAGTPTGTVSFTDGVTSLGSQMLVSHAASVSFAPGTAGSHGVAASYLGDDNFQPGQASLSLTVNEAGTTVTLSASPSPSYAGQPVSLTATVAVSSPGSGAPTGTVTFYDGGSSLGSAGVGAAGTATTSTTALLQGTHTLTAIYSGDANFGSATSAQTAQTVTVGQPAAIAVYSGDGQHAGVAAGFSDQLVVKVVDAWNNGVPGVQVVYATPLSGATAVLGAGTANTDSSGLAQVDATAGTVAGAFTVTATVTGVSAAASFALTNDPGAPARLTVDPSAATQTAQVATAFAVPLGVTVEDAYSNPVPAATVTYLAPASGATAGLASTTATTDADGHAQVSAVAGTAAGPYAVMASVPGGISGAFSLQNSSGAPSIIQVATGDAQHATVAGAFAQDLVVLVEDAYGNAVPSAAVSFQVPQQGATAVLTALAGNTGSDGRLGVTATAGTVAGAYQVTATMSGASQPAAFSLTNDPGSAAAIVATPTAAVQATQVHTSFAASLSVTVTDAYGNPVPGVQVSFVAPSSTATAALSSATATTAGDGTASVTATAGTVAGDYQVAATVAGAPTPAAFALTNLVGAPGSLAVTGGNAQSAMVDSAYGQALEVIVRDTYGNPVPSVSVAFSAPSSGASVLLSAPGATSDSNGKASVTATAGTVAGPMLVTASADGVSTPVQLTLTNLPGAAAGVVAVAGGSGQSARVGDAFAAPLSVTVVDVHGNDVPGVSVAFNCPSGVVTCTLDSAEGSSDSSGAVAVHATAGTVPGQVDVVASANGLTPITFHLTVLTGFPGSIEVVAGSSQSAGVLAAYLVPLSVAVKDHYGNSVSGAEVGFDVVATGAQRVSFDRASATTDANGRASVTATANSAQGNLTVRATVAGAAAPAVFSLTNVAVATQLSVDVVLPVFGTVIQEAGVTHLKVTAGPAAGGVQPSGTVTFRSTREMRLVPGQDGVSQAGDAIAANLVDGAADVQVQVIGWRSRTLQVNYSPDANAAPTFNPASVTVHLAADVQNQTNGGGGCSTGGGGAITLLPLVLLGLRSRRRSVRKKFMLVAVLAAGLLPRPASAQVALGGRLGYVVGGGSAAKASPMSDGLKSQLPLQLDVGYRVLPRLTVGGYGSWGMAQVGSVCSGASCSGSVVRAGVEGAWQFDRVLGLAPWAGAGAGYEWGGYEAKDGADRLKVTSRGFEVSVQGGADWQVREQLAVGPFVMVSAGRYGQIDVESPLGNSSGALPDVALHTWISVGLRGMYGRVAPSAAPDADSRAAAATAEPERLAAEKSAAEKAQAERLVAEKAAAEKTEADRLAAARAAAEKAAAEKTEADRLAAEKASALNAGRAGRGVPNAVDACPGEKGDPGAVPGRSGCPPLAVVTAGKIEIRQAVQFEAGHDRILPESEKLLRDVASVIAGHPEIARVRVEGYSDTSGRAGPNIALSDTRAKSVKRWLVEKGGVAPSRLEAKGYGPERPVASNATVEGRARNRRVEFKVAE